MRSDLIFLVNSPISLRLDSKRSARPSCADFTPSLRKDSPEKFSKAPLDGPERIIHSEDRVAS
jgi:hypothetical protein